MNIRKRPARKIVIGLVGIFSSVGSVGAAGPYDGLSEKMRPMLADSRLGNMDIGVHIQALGPDGAVILEQRADEPFKPASNQKLLITAAALSILPADFTYRTILARRGNDLIIIGSGDPSIGDPRLRERPDVPITAIFHEWADKLRADGLTEVSGDLIFDDFVFEQKFVPASWTRQHNLQGWSAAPIGGLNFNNNCVDVQIKPAPQIGAPAEVTLIPDSTYTRLANTSQTASKGEPVIQRSGELPMVVQVSGPVSRGNVGSPFSLAVIDPGMFFACAARTSLASKGIRIVGQTRRQRIRRIDGDIPADLRIVAVHESKLDDFLWRVNKSSQNMCAEALLKTVGAYGARHTPSQIGGYDTGRESISAFLKGIGVSLTGIVIDDGSGLSHDNRLTPEAIVKILAYMDRHPRRELFQASLAEPGDQEGTLRRRMHDLNGQVYAKTGYIRGASTLSGYVVGPDGQRYAFSVLCNETTKVKDGTSAARRLQDAICKTLATWSMSPVATR
ncbi:MAG: D-alanyl-D-alanine carboxypeptidase/D-alanyl-D-alanine-endopeptidase [Phycisphaerales bacterium]|nr:D-alanyl-D-alanine carboxypeptidase/D-alanyl-D-alanine-endopeptidase [Phycisphaerales bacterium]